MEARSSGEGCGGDGAIASAEQVEVEAAPNTHGLQDTVPESALPSSHPAAARRARQPRHAAHTDARSI